MTGPLVRLEIRSVSSESWGDLQRLFGKSEVLRGCWCMWPRTPYGEMAVGPQNESRLRALVSDRRQVGLLAYHGAQPVGWCSVGPVAEYTRFDAVGHEGDWLIACFAVASEARGAGVAKALLDAAVALARQQGAHAIGGIPRGWKAENPAALMGLKRAFERAGFGAATEPGSLAAYWLTLG